MNFYINCNADDKELIEAVNNTFEDVETINSHNFGDITEIIVFYIPIAALTIQTIDFILIHFANRDTKKDRTPFQTAVSIHLSASKAPLQFL